MAHGSPYRVEDLEEVRVYGPGFVWYAGLVGLLLCLARAFGRVPWGGPLDAGALALAFVLLLALVATFRRVRVEPDRVTVVGPWWRRRYALADLVHGGSDASRQAAVHAATGARSAPAFANRFWFRHGHEVGIVGAGAGGAGHDGSAESYRFRDVAGREAFSLSPWIRRRQACAHLIAGRIRHLREDAFA